MISKNITDGTVQICCNIIAHSDLNLKATTISWFHLTEFSRTKYVMNPKYSVFLSHCFHLLKVLQMPTPVYEWQPVSYCDATSKCFRPLDFQNLCSKLSKRSFPIGTN